MSSDDLPDCRHHGPLGWDRAMMLLCGAVAGPLFLLVVAIQELTRDGFDPLHQPLSLLSVGDHGWVQIANFVVTGVLNLLFAVGLRRARAGTLGPLLIAGYGFGLVLAGVFVPAGAGWHHIAHGIGGFVAFGSLIGACHVFARSRWSATGVALSVLLLASRVAAWESVALHVAAVVGWTWASLLATRFRTIR